MKNHKITGLVGTIVLHAIVLILLLVLAISKPQAREEGGVPVMLGDMELAHGNADPYQLTEVDILNKPQLPVEEALPEPLPESPEEVDMITQEDEPTVAVPKKETPKPVVKTEIVKKEVPKRSYKITDLSAKLNSTPEEIIKNSIAYNAYEYDHTISYLWNLVLHLNR